MGLKTDTQHSSISSGADSASIPSNPWSYDAEFGIVHLCGCAICRNYMLHVSDQAGGKHYAQAIAERDAELRNRFFEGFRRGRTAQLERDTERLKACRSERNVAREQVSAYEIKVDEAEKEIARLKDEIFALRIAYDEVCPRSSPPDPSYWTKYEGPEVVSDSNNSTSSDDDKSSVSDTDDDGDFEYCGYSGSSDGVWGTETTAVENDTTEDDGTPELSASSHCSLTERPNHLPTFSPPTVAEDLDTDQEATNQSLLPPSTSSSPAAPSTTFAVDEIRRKMKLAHLPGQGEVLAEIKCLVSEAHKTPNSQRTEVQKVLVLEWRRPSPTVTYKAPTPPPVTTPSELEEVVDVYVDASGAGIGFYLLGRWQAWKLKKGWSIKGRDIQWAEAVAVQMGIRLVLKAGYMKRKIRLHSDNQQVVDALSTQDINQAQVGPIVQFYTKLCYLYGLDCTVKWVPGAENPADGPSRFLSLDKNKRFPCDVTIPPDLQEFVLPYCLPE